MATLKTFEEGDTIYASETNANNQALLSLLTDNSTQVQKYVEGEVASIKSNVASVQATLQAGIDSATSIADSKVSASITKGDNGFCRLSNGLLIQWGVTGQMNANSSATINFHTAFTHTPCVTVACRQTVGEIGEAIGCLGWVSTTSFLVGVQRTHGVNTDGGVVNWIAIGV